MEVNCNENISLATLAFRRMNAVLPISEENTLCIDAMSSEIVSEDPDLTYSSNKNLRKSIP